MKELILCIWVLFNINLAQAENEQVYIIFDSGLNEITNSNTGGFSELASVLDIYRQKKPPLFFIFGGGSLSPSILSSFDKGTHIIDLLNSLEPDVMGATKRDFGFFEDELSLRSYEAAFPIVQSNIIDQHSKRNLDGILDSVLIQQAHYKFGFISIMDNRVIHEYNLTRVAHLPAHTVIKKHANQLRSQGAQLVILHYRGIDLDTTLYLNDGTVDLVLRKNDNINLIQDIVIPQHDKQVFITEKDIVGIIKLKWQKGHPQTLSIKVKKEKLINFPKHLIVHKQIKNYTNRLNLLLNEVISVTKTAINTSRLAVRTQENLFGNILTDAIKNYTNADIALLNGGTIRGESHYTENSNITRRDIAKELPFRSPVKLIEVTGHQLISALENGLSQIEFIRGRFPHLSGVSLVFDSDNPPGQRVISVEVNNEPVQLNKTYKLATSEYICKGGDGYESFRHAKHLAYNKQMSKLIPDILTDALRIHQTISPKLEGRLINLATQRKERK